MAVMYRLYQDNRETSVTKGKWYARTQMIGQVDLKAIAAKIQANVSVKESDVYAVLLEMVNIMTDELQNSHSVKIDRLGIFTTGISTTGAATASEFNVAKNVKGIHINFLPEQRYLSGTGKGSRRTTTMLAGVSITELPKNAVDTNDSL